MVSLQFSEHFRYALSMFQKNQEKMLQIKSSIKKHRENVALFSKLLESTDREVKEEFKQMMRDMKQLIKDVRSKAELLGSEKKILAMDAKYQDYTNRRNKLHD